MHQQSIQSINGYLIKLIACCYFFVLMLSSCNNTTTEQHGFITTLGNDTIAVESISRKDNTVISDEVDRFPEVRVRHTVIDLNPDGSIKHLVMDIHTPGEPSNQRDRKVTVDVADNEVHISKTDSSGTVKRDFATGGAIVEGHVPQMYSLYELYFAAALKNAAASKLAAGTPVQVRQFYIDREFDQFPLGRGRVTSLGNGKAEITHDWLSGTGEATIDSNYQMLSYSGDRTTYKVQVARLNSSPDIKNIAEHFEDVEAKKGIVRSLSVHDTAQAQVGNALLSIDYSRPLLRGRKLLGDVIPYDRVWRTGANAATQFTTSVAIKIAGLQVPAGTYALWTVPHTNSVDLIIDKQTGQWGTDYTGKQNLGIVKMTSEQLTTPVEEFTISITPVDTHHGTLVMEWGLFKWTAPIQVL